MVGTARRSGQAVAGTSGTRSSRKAYRRSACGSWPWAERAEVRVYARTRRHQAATSVHPGAESEPPNSCTESAAVSPAKASRSASGHPASVPVTNPATKTSPAPVGSSASTAMAGTSAVSRSARRRRTPPGSRG